ncbi:hypothetical protein D3C76_1354110 [compost metagenome]|uniref:hypothetical protein n=1 Tax=Pseudomonas sp. X4 TaxID=3231526 RepID=UPI000F9579CE|nr:hypothetical protein PPUN110474_24230 [Pseudomonas putida]
MAKVVRDDQVELHSQSIQKTLKEIDKLLDGSQLDKAGPLRKKLRDRILDAFDEVGKQWYRKGFNRGHRQAYEAFSETDNVPRKLKASKVRQFTPSSKHISVKLRSTLK